MDAVLLQSTEIKGEFRVELTCDAWGLQDQDLDLADHGWRNYRADAFHVLV